MDKHKELYHSAQQKDEGDRICCLFAEMMEKLERENPSMYRKAINDMEEIAYAISKDDAERIVRNMSPKGQYWTYTDITNLLKSKGIEGHDTDYYLVMNMVYNDYYRTASLYGVQKDVEFYFSLARDLIEDADAKPHKIAKYFME